jgi:hypothetical protein
MLLGAVTYNVLKDMDLETVIRTLETAGYGGVELRTGTSTAWSLRSPPRNARAFANSLNAARSAC